ncbi:hypothetical protein [Roseibium sp. RKSG952]|uniref:hypothetical protein n=1 Tax=Roseibium sp. RKSG952 TaxID=2529384 RepID=UPI0012BBB8EE|nr:hypothetical protein [Roseibium sp. RKSG952]MTH99686.1 hypothetical protein [Roseibium sp. RKSG952]
MFGLFQKTTAKEPEFVMALQAAAVENRLRARLDPLLEAAKLEIEDTNGPTEFGAAATVQVIRLVMSRAGADNGEPSSEKKFVVGLFAFLVAHDVSARVRADLGIVLGIAALEFFSKDKVGEIYRLGKSFGRLREFRSTHRVLSNTIKAFLDQPDQTKLEELALVFRCCLPSASGKKVS